MWNTLNHLILNVALTFFFVLISLFFFKRFQFRNTLDSWLKKNLLVLILATGAATGSSIMPSPMRDFNSTYRLP